MKRRTAFSLTVIIGGVVAWISVLPTVAAAGDSTADTLIGALSSKLTVLAVTIAVIFEVALLYALLRYRNSGDAKSPEYNSRFHLTYVLAVGLILFFVGFASLQTLGALDLGTSQPPPEDAIRVDIVAEQWVWKFEYRGDNVTTQGTLVVPVNETIHMRLTSRDVIHSFFAPDLGIRRDANPARWNNITFTPTNTGQYRIKCAEYCGQGHSRMRGTIRVVNRSAYDNWLDEQRGNATSIRAQ